LSVLLFAIVLSVLLLFAIVLSLLLFAIVLFVLLWFASSDYRFRYLQTFLCKSVLSSRLLFVLCYWFFLNITLCDMFILVFRCPSQYPCKNYGHAVITGWDHKSNRFSWHWFCNYCFMFFSFIEYFLSLDISSDLGILIIL
jgi:hypothetical protein